jgi:hypothetical protein
MNSLTFAIVVFLGINVLLVVTAIQHRRHARLTDRRHCGRCQSVSPGVARFCGRCGRKF